MSKQIKAEQGRRGGSAMTPDRIQGGRKGARRQRAARQCVAVFDADSSKRCASLPGSSRCARLSCSAGLISQRSPRACRKTAPWSHAICTSWPQRGSSELSKQGRHVFYQVDAGAVAERLEGILAITRVCFSQRCRRARPQRRSLGPVFNAERAGQEAWIADAR